MPKSTAKNIKLGCDVISRTVMATPAEENSNGGRCGTTLLALLLFVTSSFGASSHRPAQATAGADEPGLVQVEHVDNIDEPAREPGIVEHPDGTLFVSGYGMSLGGTQEKNVPRLWKSTDHCGMIIHVRPGDSSEIKKPHTGQPLGVFFASQREWISHRKNRSRGWPQRVGA